MFNNVFVIVCLEFVSVLYGDQLPSSLILYMSYYTRSSVARKYILETPRGTHKPPGERSKYPNL